MIFIEEALTSWVLDDYPYSVITKEKLAIQIYNFYLYKSYKGQRIQQIRKEYAAPKDFENNIHKLQRSGVLSPLDTDSHPFFRSQLHESYVIKGKREYSPQETLCALYPYGYISHLSAMEWHGLTDKIPVEIHFTTCSSASWRQRAIEDIDIKNSSIVDLKNFTAKYPKNLNLDGLPVVVSSETHYVDPVNVNDSPLRVSSVGKTFIDMLRDPQKCGGEEHVLEVFQEHGKKYSSLILSALDKYGRKIDRARTGFVLDKMVGVKSAKLEALRLESSRTRGSSKVLSPNKPFASEYDEDWSLSLNVDMAKKYGNAN
ncbi:TPA: type IV toxin-antitoxin system AbiEi family antitoxin domain-containing protein [Pseudomonas aeruginosa]|uniref:type IV toxin-antitoxin system AbiEi family antitoxin domain-containing protein n=1 Tax=Pseudomonas aeruginosa TaxID=287 RepID=UPI0009A15138|nr:hypothetical protein [Pseudomonas aeruginosa]MCT5886165.1 hypothetical protein [Pseudomonas aeruginosa]MDP5843138.1 hypothetical protein [Pseudomonas aeruginosa]MDP5942080.1 hypothetical protein [Pseudomonas aeruginosa]MDV6703287.1 hypothetical protein [Pseudomonas aeruginosa]OYP21910.1 hypothetical protein CHH44_30690 [Pseudomonas aeruginosa]